MGAEQYWIYEDPATNHARVHRHSCGHCNDGMGRLGIPGPRKMGDYWIGPFLDRHAVLVAARCLDRKNFRGAGCCNP